jgi:hypothetical protein
MNTGLLFALIAGGVAVVYLATFYFANMEDGKQERREREKMLKSKDT